MEAHYVFGFLGDLLTFSGAMLLGWDALTRERIFLRREVTMQLPSDVRFEDASGRPITERTVSEKWAVHGESIRAKYGYLLLVLGFLALFTARILELHASVRGTKIPPTCFNAVALILRLSDNQIVRIREAP